MSKNKRAYYKIYTDGRYILTVLSVSEKAARKQASRKWCNTPISKLKAELQP